MVNETAKTAHVALSQHTIEQLHARALELQCMALLASNPADKQALVTLAERFHALAERRENAAPGATKAPRRTGDARIACSLAGAKPEPAEAQSAIALRLSRAGHSDPSPDTGHHILVVDDVSDVLVAVGAFLMKEAFVIRQATSGDEALRLIASDSRIGVLITDFAMPRLNGVELIAQATQIRPNLKALVITGYPNADGLAELPPHTAILVKPFRRDTLIAGVRSLLAEMRPPPDETAKLTDSRDFESAGPITRRQL
jgi:CheY-like chemotaxis protein